MLCFFFFLSSSFIKTVVIYESCENITQSESLICVDLGEGDILTFPSFYADELTVSLFTERIKSIDFLKIKDNKISKLSINGFRINSPFILDIKALPATLKTLNLNNMVLSIKEAATVDFKLDGNPMIPLSEVSKITRGKDFSVSQELEKTFGISNKVGYIAAFVVDSCDEYSSFYSYKCIRADELDLEYYNISSVMTIYIGTDVPSDHPIVFRISSIERKLAFIGLNKTQGTGKYKVTLDVERFYSTSSIKGLNFTNLDLRFNYVSNKLPDNIKLSMSHIHLETEECNKKFFTNIGLQSFEIPNIPGNLYKCFGKMESLVFPLNPYRIDSIYISENCADIDFHPRNSICIHPDSYTDDSICSISQDSLTFYIDKNFDRLMKISCDNWKQSTLPKLAFEKYGDVDHPRYTLDVDFAKNAKELSFDETTLRLYSQKVGNQVFPANKLNFYNAYIEIHEQTKYINWTVADYFYSSNLTNYEYFNRDKSGVSFTYKKLIISDVAPKECNESREVRCIKPDEVNDETFYLFFTPYILYKVLPIEVRSLIPDGQVLNLENLKVSKDGKYTINITGVGIKPSLTIRIDDNEQRVGMIQAENINLKITTNNIEPKTFNMDFKFATDVSISGSKGLILSYEQKIKSTLRDHFEFFSVPFPSHYSQLDVKERCDEETKNDIHIKCVTSSEIFNQDFSDFSNDVGILIHYPVSDAQSLDLSKTSKSNRISIKSLLASEQKQKIKINVSSLHESQTFSFSNIDLSFDIGQNPAPMIFPASHLTLEGCTISQNECGNVKLDSSDQLTADSRAFFDCFDVTPPSYVGISVGEKVGSDYKYLEPSEVSTFDFSGFDDTSEIDIKILVDLTKDQSFKFSNLKASKSIKLTGNSKQAYWLDVSNMGNLVTSISFSDLKLGFSTTGANIISTNKISVLNCDLVSDACKSVQLKDDVYIVTDAKNVFECFNGNYPSIIVQETCPKKLVSEGVCIQKSDVASYMFDDEMIKYLSELKIITKTNLADSNTFDFRSLINVEQVTIESPTKNSFTFNAETYTKKLTLKNLNLRFKSSSQSMSFQSLDITGCTVAKDQCSVKLTLAAKNNFYTDSSDVYECLGIKTNLVLMISNNCLTHDEAKICVAPHNIDSSTYEKMKKAVSIEIHLEVSVSQNNPLRLNFSQFKMSISIKPKQSMMNEALKVYLDAESMANNLNSLSIEKVEVSFVTSKADEKVEFNFPVTLKEATVDESSCDKIKVSGGFNSDKDFSGCFGIGESSLVGDPTKKQLGTGPIVGIAVAAIVLIIVIIVSIVFFVKKKSNLSNNYKENDGLEI